MRYPVDLFRRLSPTSCYFPASRLPSRHPLSSALWSCPIYSDHFPYPFILITTPLRHRHRSQCAQIILALAVWCPDCPRSNSLDDSQLLRRTTTTEIYGNVYHVKARARARPTYRCVVGLRLETAPPILSPTPRWASCSLTIPSPFSQVSFPFSQLLSPFLLYLLYLLYG